MEQGKATSSPWNLVFFFFLFVCFICLVLESVDLIFFQRHLNEKEIRNAAELGDGVSISYLMVRFLK